MGSLGIFMRKRKRDNEVEQEETIDVEVSGDAELPPEELLEVDDAGKATQEESGTEGDVGEHNALVETPQAVIEKLEAEVDEQKEKHLRLAAEFDNFRKRVERQRAEIRQNARSEIVRPILETLDNLARVTSLDVADSSVADVISGVEMVERNLMKELEAAGLARVGREGERFDPNDHEAVSTAQAPEPEKEDHVAAVFQVGYRFGGMLLRPARVQVYVAAATDEGASEE